MAHALVEDEYAKVWFKNRDRSSRGIKRRDIEAKRSLGWKGVESLFKLDGAKLDISDPSNILSLQHKLSLFLSRSHSLGASEKSRSRILPKALSKSLYLVSRSLLVPFGMHD